jgi:ribosomal-protein-alanine N-acetyltransferase
VPGRVRLATPAPEDEAEFTSAMRASDALHGAWIAMPQDADAYAGYLARSRQDSVEMRFVRRRSDDAIVGFANLSEIIRGKLQQAFLGYGAVAAYAGRGYMTEGLELVLDLAFGELGLHRIEANIQPGNDASRRLVERVGFVQEGFSPQYLMVDGDWRDHERWATRAELWRERRTLAG